MVMNPTASLSEIAAFGGYTYTYTSILTNSDGFQSLLGKLNDEVKTEVILPALRDRIVGIATIGLSRLGDKLAVEQDTAVLSDATEMLLAAAGFGPKNSGTTVNVQQNTTIVDQGILERGRMLLKAQHLGGGVQPPAVRTEAQVLIGVADE
jgi:hypothetical protein